MSKWMQINQEPSTYLCTLAVLTVWALSTDASDDCIHTRSIVVHMFVPAVCQISTAEKLERFEQMWWTAFPFPHQLRSGKPYSLCNSKGQKQENYIKNNSLVTTATLMDLSAELVSSHCVPVEAYCTTCPHMPWRIGYGVATLPLHSLTIPQCYCFSVLSIC